jgi:hypothetical protein
MLRRTEYIVLYSGSLASTFCTDRTVNSLKFYCELDFLPGLSSSVYSSIRSRVKTTGVYSVQLYVQSYYIFRTDQLQLHSPLLLYYVSKYCRTQYASTEVLFVYKRERYSTILLLAPVKKQHYSDYCSGRPPYNMKIVRLKTICDVFHVLEAVFYIVYSALLEYYHEKTTFDHRNSQQN